MYLGRVSPWEWAVWNAWGDLVFHGSYDACIMYLGEDDYDLC